jgi:hypothetical protein
MSRYGLRIGDLEDWEEFVKKYNYLYKIYQEKEKLTLDPDEELAQLKHLREQLREQHMITDTINLLVRLVYKMTIVKLKFILFSTEKSQTERGFLQRVLTQAC